MQKKIKKDAALVTNIGLLYIVTTVHRA